MCITHLYFHEKLHHRIQFLFPNDEFSRESPMLKLALTTYSFKTIAEQMLYVTFEQLNLLHWHVVLKFLQLYCSILQKDLSERSKKQRVYYSFCCQGSFPHWSFQPQPEYNWLHGWLKFCLYMPSTSIFKAINVNAIEFQDHLQIRKFIGEDDTNLYLKEKEVGSH